MERRPIEIEEGAILPVKRARWADAHDKLLEAEAGIQQMCGAKDRAQYENGWARFVDSLEEFWSRFFEEGKGISTKFQPWAGTIITTRKNEPLLTYLTQARHQSQHGRIGLVWDESKHNIAPNFTGHIKKLAIFPDGTFAMDATPAHESVPEAKVVFSPGDATLPVVENKKHKQRFEPVYEFCGESLAGLAPHDIAMLALDFYEGVLNNARAKFDSEQAADKQ